VAVHLDAGRSDLVASERIKKIHELATVYSFPYICPSFLPTFRQAGKHLTTKQSHKRYIVVVVAAAVVVVLASGMRQYVVLW
jgi:hypothetical protein